jgi:hypothetical protein
LKFPHSFLFRFLFRNFPLPATQYTGNSGIGETGKVAGGISGGN